MLFNEDTAKIEGLRDVAIATAFGTTLLYMVSDGR